jgi:hypothetical protein
MRKVEPCVVCSVRAVLHTTCCYFLIEPILLILGTIKESGAKHKGLIEIPNLSEENEVDDTEVFGGIAFF